MPFGLVSVCCTEELEWFQSVTTRKSCSQLLLATINHLLMLTVERPVEACHSLMKQFGSFRHVSVVHLSFRLRVHAMRSRIPNAGCGYRSLQKWQRPMPIIWLLNLDVFDTHVCKDSSRSRHQQQHVTHSRHASNSCATLSPNT